jgi:hypothetical protein
MSLLSKTAFAALLLGSTIAAPVFAASPDTTGCPAGMHRADSEGGPGWQQQASSAHKADSEGGPGWQQQASSAHKADSEGGPGYQRQASAAVPCIK